MPTIASSLGKCVFFLYRKDPITGTTKGPFGTGFFVRMGMSFFYGVTNHHVAFGAGATVIRVNGRNGSARYMEFSAKDWHFVPDPTETSKPRDDVCAVQIGRSEESSDSRYLWHQDDWDAIDIGLLMRQDEIEQEEIGLGENAFMIGLFVQHHGGERNVPTARFGNVAMLANDKAMVRWGGKTRAGEIFFSRPAYLIDMRSRTGFSGSPVFIYQTPLDDLTKTVVPRFSSQKRGRRTQDTRLKLVGIHCSQFRDLITVRRAQEEKGETIESVEAEPTEAGMPIGKGDDLVIPGSMTIVVPSWHIDELLRLEVFEKPRREFMTRITRQQLSKA